MKIIRIAFILLLFTQTAFAQNAIDSTQTASVDVIEKIQQPENGGAISIQQDEQLTELINRHIEINKDNKSKISGWRIQIYQSNGSDTKQDANEVRNKFLAKYPDIEAYTIYQPPFFKIRVGNYRTRVGAYLHYRMILKDFPVSYIVEDTIELPKLEE